MQVLQTGVFATKTKQNKKNQKQAPDTEGDTPTL